MNPHGAPIPEGRDTARQEMLAALCLMGEGEKAGNLFPFASLKDQEKLTQIAARLRREELLKFIQRLTILKPFSTLYEIHPGWILEKLRGESPRLLGLLCRFLTGEKVQYLIRHISPDEQRHLPRMNESYRVSPKIAEMVREAVEKKMAVSLPPRSGESFSFPHIAWMKTDDLRTLFWDLGLEEIRKAFSGVEPQILRTFLARFSLNEAREIRGRIESGKAVSPEERREAQGHLVALSLEQLPPEDLFREIGFSVFAKSLTSREIGWADWISQKLSPEEGYRFKRVVQETDRPAEGDAERRKEAILNRLFLLAQKGLIRRYWKEESRAKGKGKW